LEFIHAHGCVSSDLVRHTPRHTVTELYRRISLRRALATKYDSGRMGQSYEALHGECPLRLGALDGLPAKNGREGIKHHG
jgi:hypothetical protein